eukprot:TRINITY_DN64590_c0_g1_i1.p1 TRINITY_DN64590_c0_g1~~TRINITY_DN64590_c0_g1_i1.p1  ORF type:complete len:174 (+),score=22.08 TRINITY_DN64590_c0_g1_i1:81-602(+)
MTRRLLLALTLCSGTDAADNVTALLRQRLIEAAGVIASSTSDKPVYCECEDYCSGQCFAASCATCEADTWSFPGGADLCADPGPLGTGLLCRRDPATREVVGKACCSTDSGSPCQLKPGSCCASGSCKSCPPSPAKEAMFPRLDDPSTGTRRFDGSTNKCTDRKPLLPDTVQV